MTQVLPRYCPRCGAPIVTSSGTCATCGLALESILSRGQYKSPEQVNHDQEYLPEIDQQFIQDEPGVQQENELDRVPTLQLGQQINLLSGTQSFTKKGEQDSPNLSTQNRRRMGRKELMLLFVVLLFVLGAVAYAFAGFLGVALPGFVIIQPSITTTAINASVPYAGVDITILNVQQSQSFVKDPNTSTNGMVRLNLRERNPTDINVVWSYATIARLIVPDTSLVSPTYVNSVVRVAPGSSQTSFVDFAVPMNNSVNKLTLVLGATNEAQMLIPLFPSANISKYQPKTINLNGQMQYFGLNWTLTSATSSLSIQGQQAAKGMRFITLVLKVDNTLSQVAITGSAYEYMRLQYSNISALPEYTTIPVAFNVAAVGTTGTVSFQVPQQRSSFTLILMPQKGDNGDQGSTDFHLP
ncbi:MAG TPA: hypothetical protein VIX20_10965 [Ktedonobacteraceae bacterium]